LLIDLVISIVAPNEFRTGTAAQNLLGGNISIC
jgi:hypothetical protein